MLPAVFTRTIIHGLDWVGQRVLPADARPRHQRTGTRGEEDAYFHLRKLGYVMVARNFRSPRRRGEIDLIGWEADVLCFIEVKTRTSRDVKTAEAAVDRHKRREVAAGGTGVPEAASTNVPVEIRYRERILCASDLPPADRSISQCFLVGVKYEVCAARWKGFSNCLSSEKIRLLAGG